MSQNRRWLITGATGLLSDYLIDACHGYGQVTTTARSGGDRTCDLSDVTAAQSLLCATAPDIVINAAGLTDVDQCEREPAMAYAVNRDISVHLAAGLQSTARLVFISTDQVYPDTPGPHGEREVGPVNVYGDSKLQGERATLSHPGALVVRTNFFGVSRRPGRISFSDFVVDSLTARKPVKFFSDLSFSPLHMSSLAALIVELVNKDAVGVFNAGCHEGMSKADFARAIAQHKALCMDTAEIGSSGSLPGRAPRARDLRMDVTCLEIFLGRPMPILQQEIGKL